MRRHHFFYPAEGKQLIVFNKPYGVLCQFTDADGRATLKDYIDVPDVYPAGRLDRDSEGLVVLTDDGKLQAKIADPKFKLAKTYLAQVERVPDEAALQTLRTGVRLKDGMTAPAAIERISEPDLWPRDPPVRFRKQVPTAWLKVIIREGRNRQVRRMTAAVGHPTLRLVRIQVGSVGIGGLSLAEYQRINRI